MDWFYQCATKTFEQTSTHHLRGKPTHCLTGRYGSIQELIYYLRGVTYRVDTAASCEGSGNTELEGGFGNAGRRSSGAGNTRGGDLDCRRICTMWVRHVGDMMLPHLCHIILTL